MVAAGVAAEREYHKGTQCVSLFLVVVVANESRFESALIGLQLRIVVRP